ncbi:hypothetical protein FACS1894139_17300 [Planctomycetales bacterium]|nr:hypothetical protein FACS1894107_06170 [Planctomycetales bacterium]GHT08085.1 hypothetical protein FACS1894139_17300 [Planctomycetales bacterium]
MGIEQAASFIDKVKSDGNLQGELLKIVSGLLGGGKGAGGDLMGLVGGLLGGGAAGNAGGATGGGDILQAVVNFAKGKGFDFLKGDLSKALGDTDIAGLLAKSGGLGGLLGGQNGGGLDLGGLFKQS